MSDYSFITDRLAIGNVASRATPGFCAVVSLLATQPWDEVTGAPKVRGEYPFIAESNQPWEPRRSWEDIHMVSLPVGCIPVLHLDLADAQTQHPRHETGEVAGPDLDTYLDDATSFIAAHLRRGCVLVHCGAGKSRSVSVVIAYLCRYAGMSFAEAAAFVAERRPGACPAPCFAEAIKRWLRLDELATKGPRR